mmetsp:Transcript_35731/g.65785  ORF Transcript_35731/g.65785 Transcript_35731/m.65785 type:complete len:511 (+) Transcript_35731:496-2028(+)
MSQVLHGVHVRHVLQVPRSDGVHAHGALRAQPGHHGPEGVVPELHWSEPRVHELRRAGTRSVPPSVRGGGGRPGRRGGLGCVRLVHDHGHVRQHLRRVRRGPQSSHQSHPPAGVDRHPAVRPEDGDVPGQAADHAFRLGLREHPSARRPPRPVRERGRPEGAPNLGGVRRVRGILARKRPQQRRQARLRHLQPQRRRSRRSPGDAHGHRRHQAPVHGRQHGHLVRHGRSQRGPPLREPGLQGGGRIDAPVLDALHRRPARRLDRAARGLLAQRGVRGVHVADGQRGVRPDEGSHRSLRLVPQALHHRGIPRVAQPDRDLGADARGRHVLGAAASAAHGEREGVRPPIGEDDEVHPRDRPEGGRGELPLPRPGGGRARRRVDQPRALLLLGLSALLHLLPEGRSPGEPRPSVGLRGHGQLGGGSGRGPGAGIDVPRPVPEESPERGEQGTILQGVDRSAVRGSEEDVLLGGFDGQHGLALEYSRARGLRIGDGNVVVAVSARHRHRLHLQE